MHRRLLVPHEDVLHLLLLEDRVVDVENRTAGVAEDVLDALFLQTAYGDFRACDFHNLPFKSREPGRRRQRNGLATATSTQALERGLRN